MKQGCQTAVREKLYPSIRRNVHGSGLTDTEDFKKQYFIVDQEEKIESRLGKERVIIAMNTRNPPWWL